MEEIVDKSRLWPFIPWGQKFDGVGLIADSGLT